MAFEADGGGAALLCRIHAVSPGRQRDKPLMLMVHGFPETWYSWWVAGGVMQVDAFEHSKCIYD